MKLSPIPALLSLAVAVSGCAQAVIADLEEDKVIVEASGNDHSLIQAEARKGCQIHGREPVSISYSCMDQYCIRARYLFACKEVVQSTARQTQVPVNESQQPIKDGAQLAATTWDGEWFAQAGAWQLYVQIENGSFTGRARHPNASPYDVSGQILQDGLVAGRVNGNAGSPWGSLSGSFPSVSLVQNGQVQASFELAKKI
jgi:hypothetical protein